MSKGGDGGGTSVVIPDVPDYAQQYVQNILAAGEEEFIRPYVQYGGPRIAEVSPQRLMAQEAVEQYASEGSPVYGEALDLTRGLIREQQQPMTFGSAEAEAYMSPYYEAVIERQKASAIEDYQKQRAARDAAAVQAGAFGGSRQAVQEAQAESGLLSRLGQIEAAGRQSAFENAQSQYERDRAARQQALGAQAAGIGQLSGLGGAAEQSLLGRISALEEVGAAEEVRRQLALDQAYQEFLRQQAFPEEQLSKFSALIRGQGTQTVDTSEPNIAQQLLGLGISGVSLAGAINQLGQGAAPQ